jgi:hypothetical protein
MGLFKPAWRSRNEAKALAAAKKETDQAKLAEMAREAPVWRARSQAVGKLEDQAVLEWTARNDEEPRVRATAARKLQDKALAEELLRAIVLSDADWPLRDSILADLATDQPFLEEIARRDKNRMVRRTAVERLSSQDLLKEIFANDPEPVVQVAAIRRILDKEFVGHHLFPDEEPSPRIREAALETFRSDRSRLESVVAIDPAHRVRKRAAEMLGLNVPKKKGVWDRARTMASAAVYQMRIDDLHAAIRSGTAQVKPYSPQAASNYLAMSNPQPSAQAYVAAAREIALEAITYIAWEVNLGMKPDLELLAHSNAIMEAMDLRMGGLRGDAADIQGVITAMLIEIGRGGRGLTGPGFPTQVDRLVYLISDKDKLKEIVELPSHVYEYQKIKTAAEAVLADCD